MKKFISAALIALLTLAASSTVSAEEMKLSHDIVADGILNIVDLAALQSSVLYEEPYSAEYDINNDKVVDGKDSFIMKQYLLGCIPKLPEPTVSTGTIDESAILEPKGVVHTGEATFYGGGYEGGCCMLDPIPPEWYVVAMNYYDFNNAQLSGAYIEVTGERGTLKVHVTDLLPEGKLGDLDLNTDAFPFIADPIKGRVPVSWKIIPLETDEPVSYRFKEGSTEFWCGVQVRNHRYPVTKFEYLDENGEFIEVARRHYNYFETDKMGAGPFTFRVTDIYGQVIIDENIPMSVDIDTPGKSQFPY